MNIETQFNIRNTEKYIDTENIIFTFNIDEIESFEKDNIFINYDIKN